MPMVAISVATLPFGIVMPGMTGDVVRIGMPPCTVMRLRWGRRNWSDDCRRTQCQCRGTERDRTKRPTERNQL